ncbi:MAG: 5-methyltetrahydropteroyltriglutamate--homocysteine methyltransferase, partial [Planctomycetota bacterium]
RFMCGALSAKKDPERELAFARDLLNATVQGLPAARTAIHVCRGNWTRDETAAMTGGYAPLLPFLRSLRVGTFFLEACTPRAGGMDILRGLPDDRRIGIGVVNQKRERIETVEEVLAKANQAIDLFGRDRVLLNPDCGFATFSANPVASVQVAEGKLRAIAQASLILRNG